MSMLRPRDTRGFTYVDACVLLIAVVVLSSILLTNIGDYVRLAQLARAKQDLDELCDALGSYILDTGEARFREHRSLMLRGPLADDNADEPGRPVGLLMGRGAVPIFRVGELDAQARMWTRHPGDGFELPDDLNGEEVHFAVDTFGRHLGGGRQGAPAAAADGRFSWRGPYVDTPVAADPWGQRYMANVFGLHAADNDGEFGSAVVCYSAGPDAGIDTGFNQPVAWATGDDDLTVTLAAGGMR